MRSSHRGRRAELNCRTFLCLISASLLAMGAILFLNSVRRSSDPSLQRHGKEVLHLMYNGSNNFDDLVLWSSDFHISPIADIKNVMEGYKVKVIDKSLSGHCHLSGTCQHDLRVINKDNGISLGSCPNKLIEEFYKSYKSDSEMRSVSAFLCTHAASLCELFMPFDRPMIIIASTRYEIGRHSAERWDQWNQNIRLISEKPFNVIAANSRYDQEYLKYFTGVKDVLLLPNLCGYITARYNPVRSQVLIAPARGVSPVISAQLDAALFNYYANNMTSSAPLVEKPRLQFAHIRSLYPRFQYTDIASHAAIVILPYQISFMSLFEFYRMGVPLFVPSPLLLTEWHMRYGVLNERTWATVLGLPPKSVIKKHPESSSRMQFDPNDESSKVAVHEWILLADFYQWPFITTFESWDELFSLLENADLKKISSDMLQHNRELEVQIKFEWRNILMKIRNGVQGKSRQGDGTHSTYGMQEALSQAYGLKLSEECVGQSIQSQYSAEALP